MLLGGVVLGVVAALTVTPRGADVGRDAPATTVGSVVTLSEAVDVGPEGPGYALWGLDRNGAPLRWDPCDPIRFVMNPDGAPPSAEADLRTALALLAATSGLDLAFEGPTEERPAHDRPLVERHAVGVDTTGGPTWRWRPVLVAWAVPGEGGLPLTPLDRGVALPVAVRDRDREAFVTGQVVMNRSRDDLTPGFADRSDSLGALLVHELAHVLGLDHVDDPDELMWTEPGAGPVRLEPGDRAGLRAIGADAGCLAVPDPSVGRGLDVRRS